MNREGGIPEKEIAVDEVEDDVEVAVETEDTVVLSDDAVDIDDDDEDFSAEYRIEELVAKIESGDGDAVAHRKEIRRRLDELEEQRRIEKELENTFNFNLDDDF